MDDASNPFAPLTPAELAEAARQDAQSEAGRGAAPTCPPADAEPVALAAARLHGRKPDGLWRYATADDETASYTARWNEADGKKTFRPVSWRKMVGWQLEAWPDNRPLFNLPELVSKPKASVVVCEGEKAAEAAAAIFPNSIATTSSGGAGAAAKTDWTPLAGRLILIWPDHDAAGAKYAREVAAILAALGCFVFIIDAKALAAIDPAGGTREPRDKWDAADAAAEWSDRAALRKTANGLRKPFDPGPAFVSHGAFAMTARGLEAETTRRSGGNQKTLRERVSGAFEILGKSRNPKGGDWGLWLRWHDGDGRTHTRLVAFADLHGEPAALCRGLAADGLHIERSKQHALADYLNGAEAHGRVTRVETTGWHTIGGRDVFVLPGGTIGPSAAEIVILDGGASAPYEASGTLADWRENVGVLASGQVLPMLAISAALVGPLLSPAKGEGGGVHIFGPSSKGKTTLLQMSASVWGRGATPGFVRAWRATLNGLEGGAALATDTALILDEMGILDPREAAAAIYALANGGGKQRASRNGDLREPKSWRVSIISSGEIPLEAKLTEGKGKARAGQLIRLLDIPADRGLGFGAFDHGGETGDAGALARAIKAGASTSYGTAGPEFVRRLIREGVTGDDVRAMVAEFVKEVCPPRADGQIERAAHRLGLISAAGELAIALDVAPWPAGDAKGASAWAFKAWLGNRGGLEPAEARQALNQVRLFIEQHGDSRFDPLDNLKPGLLRTGPAGAKARARKGNGLFRRKHGRRRFAAGLIRNSLREPLRSAG